MIENRNELRSAFAAGGSFPLFVSNHGIPPKIEPNVEGNLQTHVGYASCLWGKQG